MSNIKRRVERLEEKIDTRKLLPLKEMPFLAIDNEDGTAEEKVERREKELMELYGTIEGFRPILVKFTKPKEQDEP